VIERAGNVRHVIVTQQLGEAAQDASRGADFCSLLVLCLGGAEKRSK
jgi:hypothetical protein